MSSLTSLGDALDDKMGEESTLQKQVDASKIIEISEQVLEEMFGEEQAMHGHPQYFKNGTVTISCSSSTMAQEIRLNQDEIVENVNEKLGKDKVDSIRYLS